MNMEVECGDGCNWTGVVDGLRKFWVVENTAMCLLKCDYLLFGEVNALLLKVNVLERKRLCRSVVI